MLRGGLLSFSFWNGEAFPPGGVHEVGVTPGYSLIVQSACGGIIQYDPLPFLHVKPPEAPGSSSLLLARFPHVTAACVSLRLAISFTCIFVQAVNLSLPRLDQVPTPFSSALRFLMASPISSSLVTRDFFQLTAWSQFGVGLSGFPARCTTFATRSYPLSDLFDAPCS